MRNVDRVNAEGIRRKDLVWALQSRRLVLLARRRCECMLCRGAPVDECGLCTLCASQATEVETLLIERWRAGQEP